MKKSVVKDDRMSFNKWLKKEKIKLRPWRKSTGERR